MNGGELNPLHGAELPTSPTSQLLPYSVRSGDLDESDQLPMHSAAFFGRFSVLSDLISRSHQGQKSRLAEKDSNGNTVLHYAVEGGDRSLGCVALLLQNKYVEKNAQNDHGLTPLHVSAMRGLESTMQALLLSGVRTDLTDAVGDTPMHVAGAARQLRCMELLKSSGASLSAKNRRGLTPFDVTPATQEALCHAKTDCCVIG